MANLSLPVPLNSFSRQQAVLEAEAPKLSHREAFPVANPTQSFWQRDLEISLSLSEGSEGPLTDDADVCIIGSGISGVSAAYHLAKFFAQENPGTRPIKAVILDARDFCQTSLASASSSCLIRA